MWEEIRFEVIWSPLKKFQRLQVEITFKKMWFTGLFVRLAHRDLDPDFWYCQWNQWIRLEFPQGSLQNPTVDTQLATLGKVQSLHRFIHTGSIPEALCKIKGTWLMASTHLKHSMRCFDLHMKHCKPVPQKNDYMRFLGSHVSLGVSLFFSFFLFFSFLNKLIL